MEADTALHSWPTAPRGGGGATQYASNAYGRAFEPHCDQCRQLSQFGLRADGTVWAWGRNNDGQLGDGTTTRNPPPCKCQD